MFDAANQVVPVVLYPCLETHLNSGGYRANSAVKLLGYLNSSEL